MCVCVRARVLSLAVCSQCVLSKETFAIIFSEGERGDTKGRRERDAGETNGLLAENKASVMSRQV